MFVLLEIESEPLGKPDLKKIVVKRLLREADLSSGFF
jgi:hypothetical protein